MKHVTASISFAVMATAGGITASAASQSYVGPHNAAATSTFPAAELLATLPHLNPVNQPAPTLRVTADTLRPRVADQAWLLEPNPIQAPTEREFASLGEGAIVVAPPSLAIPSPADLPVTQLLSLKALGLPPVITTAPTADSLKRNRPGTLFEDEPETPSFGLARFIPAPGATTALVGVAAAAVFRRRRTA